MSAATTTDIPMPRLSDSMEEGTILAWLKQAGEQVEAGMDLVEIETDKATMTYAAESSGTLQILAEEGSTVAVGETIARLGPAGGEPVPAAEGAAPSATPLARRIAGAHGVSLASIGSGSGLRGRITKDDVLAAAGIAPSPPPIPASAAPAPREVEGAAAPAAAVESAKGGSTIEEPTRLQAVIARRMAEAKAAVPHFQVQTEVRMDAAIELRAGAEAAAFLGMVRDLLEAPLRVAL